MLAGHFLRFLNFLRTSYSHLLADLRIACISSACILLRHKQVGFGCVICKGREVFSGDIYDTGNLKGILDAYEVATGSSIVY